MVAKPSLSYHSDMTCERREEGGGEELKEEGRRRRGGGVEGREGRGVQLISCHG